MKKGLIPILVIGVGIALWLWPKAKGATPKKYSIGTKLMRWDASHNQWEYFTISDIIGTYYHGFISYATDGTAIPGGFVDLPIAEVDSQDWTTL